MIRLHLSYQLTCFARGSTPGATSYYTWPAPAKIMRRLPEAELIVLEGCSFADVLGRKSGNVEKLVGSGEKESILFEQYVRCCDGAVK